jgi:DNA-binding GntR family transcriptional regulator
VSRPPAERALKLLVSEGVLQLTIAGKFLRPPLQLSPNNERSISVEEVAQDPDQEGLNSPSRASWLALYDHVLQVVMSVIPFGSYRLVESTMAGYFGVSRSITNDVLARLEERGLIHRGANGRWQIQQLNQSELANIYELRRTLEPIALVQSASGLNDRFMQEAIKRIDEAKANVAPLSRVDANRIEHDLHSSALENCPNVRLLGVVRNCQVLRESQLYTPHQTASSTERLAYLGEHRLVFEALERRAHKAAAEALVFHLDQSRQRAAKRLMDAAMAAPPDLPSFLMPIGDELESPAD